MPLDRMRNRSESQESLTSFTTAALVLSEMAFKNPTHARFPAHVFFLRNICENYLRIKNK